MRLLFFLVIILLSSSFVAGDRFREVGAGNNELLLTFVAGSELRYWFIPPVVSAPVPTPPAPSGGGAGGKTEQQIIQQIEEVEEDLPIAPAPFSTLGFLEDIGEGFEKASPIFRLAAFVLILSAVVFRKKIRGIFVDDEEEKDEKDIDKFLVGKEEKKK